MTSVISLADVLSGGRFRFIHEYINEQNFPHMRDFDRVALSSIRVISPNREMPSDWALHYIRKQHLYPGTIYLAALYAAAYPDMEFRLPIVILGTVVDYVEPGFPDSRRAPHCVVMQDMSHRRGISLAGMNGKWGRGCSYLAYSV